MTITLTEEREEKIYNYSSLLQSNKSITARELAQTIGIPLEQFLWGNFRQTFGKL